MTNPYLNLGGDEEEENPYLNLGQQRGIGDYLSRTVAPASTQIPSIPQTPRKPVSRNQTFLGEEAGQALSSVGGAVKGAGKGLLEGLTDSLKRTGAFISQTGMQLNEPTARAKAAPLPEVEGGTQAEQAARMFGRGAGQIAGELPLYAATSGMVNPLVRGTATKLLGPTATKVAGKLAKSEQMREAIAVGITTIPQEVIAGSIAEGILRPESFGTWQGALRTGILSSAGSLFNAGFAYSAAIKNAKSLAEVAEIQRQIDEIGLSPRYLEEARRIEIEGETAINNPPNTQLLSAQELATQRQFPTQQGGQLPSAFEAGWQRMQQNLTKEAELRTAQLQNVKPTPEKDVLKTAAESRTVDVDPLIRAQARGVTEDLTKIQQQLNAGKGAQTNVTPDLGVTQTPNQFLTAAELQQYLDVLNMASVMSQPTFKKGQRFIIPKVELPTAEEIAGRATGGPIKKIDPTIQASMKDVQRRLDEAAATRNGTLDPEEAADIVNEMLTMSRRLSRGFEVPRTTPPRAAGPASEAATRNVQGWDLPMISKIDEPGFNASANNDDYKRWVTGSDTPEAVAQAVAAPEVAQAKAISYAEASRNIADSITHEPQRAGFFDKMKEFVSNIRPNLINRAEFLGRYNKKAQDALELLSGISAYADEFYNNQMRIAVRNPDGSIGQRVVEGRPLGQMVAKLSDDEIVDFDGYLKALTSLEQKAIDPEFKLDRPIEEFQVKVEQAPDYIKALGNEFKIISDALVDDAVAMGRLSTDSADRMKSKFYAGLSRVFNNPSLQQSLMRRTGSLRKSISPVQLMKDNIYNMLNKSRRNYAYSRLLEDYKAEPVKYNGIMEPVDVKEGLYTLQGYKELVEDFQKNAGMTLKDAEDLAGLMTPSLDRTDRALLIYDQGKPTFWRVNEDIKKAIDAFNPIEMGILKALGSVISRPTRTGVSVALDLSGIGPASDMILTAARTPEFYPWDSIRGLYHSALKTDMYQERVAALGGYGSQYLKGEEAIPVGLGAGFIRRGGDIIASPLTMLQSIVRPLSDASRMGEYLVRREKLGETAMSAALGSRRTLGDFNRVGALMRGWSLVTEFGNVGIQSADAAAKFAKDIVIAAMKGDVAPLLRAATVFGGAITAPTVYFWAASQGDKEIEALRKGKNGYRYWWTRMPFDAEGAKEGEIVKVPKLGWWAGQMFGSSVEMMLDGMDTAAQKRFADGILSQVGINTLPLTIGKIAGLVADTRNMDWSMALGLTERIPITPRGQQGLMPIVQGNERTTPFGRMAAQAGFNPFKADFALEAAGGSLFSSVVRNLGDGPVKLEKSDLPIFGRYFVSSKTPTEGSEMFYKDLKKAQEADKSFRKAAEFGDAVAAEKILTENAQIIGLKKMLEATSAQISEMNSLMLTIVNDDTISPEGKRQYLDNIRKAQQEIFMAYANARKQMPQ